MRYDTIAYGFVEVEAESIDLACEIALQLSHHDVYMGIVHGDSPPWVNAGWLVDVHSKDDLEIPFQFTHEKIIRDSNSE